MTRATLRGLLHTLFELLSGPLHSKEKQEWQMGASEFAKDSEVVLKYKKVGRPGAGMDTAAAKLPPAPIMNGHGKAE